MFKVGDHIEWCSDGDFEKYGSVNNLDFHDFGVITEAAPYYVFVILESGGSSSPRIQDIRKVPTYTKAQIKAFLETLSEKDDSWFTSERKIAEQVFDWFEAFVNKPTQDEEELKALKLLKSRGYRVEK